MKYNDMKFESKCLVDEYRHNISQSVIEFASDRGVEIMEAKEKDICENLLQEFRDYVFFNSGIQDVIDDLYKKNEDDEAMTFECDISIDVLLEIARKKLKGKL